MPLDTLASFTLVCAISAVVPGPNVLLAVRARLAGGDRAACAAILGISIARLLWGTLAVTGVSAVFEQAPALFVAIKLIGAAYIGRLGVALLRDGMEPAPADGRDADEPPRATFGVEGLLTGLLNPSTFLFYLAVFPQFLGDTRPPLVEAMTLVSVHVVIGAAWFAAVARTLGRLGADRTNTTLSLWGGRGLGLGLVGFAAAFAVRL